MNVSVQGVTSLISTVKPAAQLVLLKRAYWTEREVNARLTTKCNLLRFYVPTAVIQFTPAYIQQAVRVPTFPSSIVMSTVITLV